MYLICDVALHEHLFVMKHHMIEKLCNFLRELFMECHHLAKCGGHRYCGHRDVFSLPHDLARPCD